MAPQKRDTTTDRIKVTYHDEETGSHTEVCTECGEETDVYGCGAEDCAKDTWIKNQAKERQRDRRNRVPETSR